MPLVFRDLPRVRGLSADEIQERYGRTSTPVILEGNAGEWPAVKRWTPEFFKQSLGHLQFRPTVDMPLKGAPGFLNWQDHQKDMSLAAFVDLMSESPTPCYLRQQSVDKFPGLEKDYDLNDLVHLEGREHSIFVWIGSKNVSSSLHFDKQANFLTQIFGRKAVRLFSPEQTRKLYPFPRNINTSRVDPYEEDFETYPRLQSAEGMKGILHPGDSVFIPTLWWHHLRSLDPSISLNCFYGEKCTLGALFGAIRAGGVQHCATVGWDFFWLGLLHRPYQEKMITETPTGKYLYQLVADGVSRRAFRR